MKTLAVLGAGTGGTIVANRMRKRLGKDWRVVVVDPRDQHLYQPGLLFLPFGRYEPEELLRARKDTFRSGVEWLRSEVVGIDGEARRVEFAEGEPLSYDLLVVASGVRLRPDLTEGLTGPGWREKVFDFYSLEGASALRAALSTFEGGRLVLNVVENPIKCPVAPLEFLFLADEYFTRRGVRDRVELVYATPLDAAFTKPQAAKKLGYLLEEKKVHLVTEFMTSEVDGAAGHLRSYDEREEPFDLLVTIPTHSGAAFVERSQLGDELAFLPTDPHTLRSKNIPGAFVVGDATDLPTSKAGSVAHFEAEVVCDNLLLAAKGEEPEPLFDGHANCFVETGWGKALLLDFNYETEPLPGRFPTPWGPFTLLEESRRNHWGKLAFHWLYWNALLPGRPLPVEARMSLTGKELPQETTEQPERAEA
ncbi:MAG: NAD(P)/FAD-dependent oxidoreductase [Planctomycetota bacterium]|nr:MAG: NAD(P)/FAD-dependent oxidoreductase [Planctomycetota bacterium]